jgi:hypothetical protein
MATASMSSLAKLPEITGFFSYAREDDESLRGSLSALRDGIQRELSAQLGRPKKTFRLWQDQQAIAPGTLWESQIKNAVSQSVFFIPIVTPRLVNSQYCKFEFDAFLAREEALGRADLVFPILYISVPALEDEAQWRNDPVLSAIGKRQYVDWQRLRHRDIDETAVREAIERFCRKIVEALQKPWLPPEERVQQLEAERLAEEARRKAEAEAKERQRKEEEQRRKQDEERKKALDDAARKKAEDEAKEKNDKAQNDTEGTGDKKVQERRRQKEAAANWRSFGSVLEKAAKVWGFFAALAFLWALVGALKGSAGPWIGNNYVPGLAYGANLVECVVFGFIPAGLIYAVARALQRR